MEFEAFGQLDQPDLYYEYFPTVYPGRRGIYTHTHSHKEYINIRTENDYRFISYMSIQCNEQDRPTKALS